MEMKTTGSSPKVKASKKKTIKPKKNSTFKAAKRHSVVPAQTRYSRYVE